MRKFLADPSAARAPSPAARPRRVLGLDALEARDCPSLLASYSWVLLNPQPLPPRVISTGLSSTPGEWVTLNPQPLPPKAGGVGNLGDWVLLNPQPLPPRDAGFGDQAIIIVSGTPADRVSLNPQPLPPREFDVLSDRAIIIVSGHQMLNPQPLPPQDDLGGVVFATLSLTAEADEVAPTDEAPAEAVGGEAPADEAAVTEDAAPVEPEAPAEEAAAVPDEAGAEAGAEPVATDDSAAEAGWGDEYVLDLVWVDDVSWYETDEAAAASDAGEDAPASETDVTDEAAA